MIQIGDKFGKLTVQAEAGMDRWYCRKWLCACECGNTKVILGKSLTAKLTKSCGCWSREHGRQQGLRNATHGATRIKPDGQRRVIPEYKTWQEMRNRCYNVKCKSYPIYGGRGIQVCEHWRDSFEAFLADVGHRPTLQHSLDRINNDGNYEPGNVRWATRKEQCRNTRRNKRITINGETRCVTEWAEIAGCDPSLIEGRIKRGWTGARLLIPARKFQWRSRV